MSTTSAFRLLIILRASWMLLEWLFDWGRFSAVTTLSLTHPLGQLVANAIGVAFWLAIFLGMCFFQDWARWTFAVLVVIAWSGSPFLMRRYSLSAAPSFVAPVGVLMCLFTIAIAAMSLLPPIRDHFA